MQNIPIPGPHVSYLLCNKTEQNLSMFWSGHSPLILLKLYIVLLTLSCNTCYTSYNYYTIAMPPKLASAAKERSLDSPNLHGSSLLRRKAVHDHQDMRDSLFNKVSMA